MTDVAVRRRTAASRHLRNFSPDGRGGTNSELSRVKYDISRGYTHVGGRGCVHCVCNYGPLLQVSRSTQKLLALSQVSEQTIQVAIHVLSIRSGFFRSVAMRLCDACYYFIYI